MSLFLIKNFSKPVSLYFDYNANNFVFFEINESSTPLFRLGLNNQLSGRTGISTSKWNNDAFMFEAEENNFNDMGYSASPTHRTFPHNPDEEDLIQSMVEGIPNSYTQYIRELPIIEDKLRVLSVLKKWPILIKIQYPINYIYLLCCLLDDKETTCKASNFLNRLSIQKDHCLTNLLEQFICSDTIDDNALSVFKDITVTDFSAYKALCLILLESTKELSFPKNATDTQLLAFIDATPISANLKGKPWYCFNESEEFNHKLEKYLKEIIASKMFGDEDAILDKVTSGQDLQDMYYQVITQCHSKTYDYLFPQFPIETEDCDIRPITSAEELAYYTSALAIDFESFESLDLIASAESYEQRGKSYNAPNSKILSGDSYLLVSYYYHSNESESEYEYNHGAPFDKAYISASRLNNAKCLYPPKAIIELDGTALRKFIISKNEPSIHDIENAIISIRSRHGDVYTGDTKEHVMRFLIHGIKEKRSTINDINTNIFYPLNQRHDINPRINVRVLDLDLKHLLSKERIIEHYFPEYIKANLHRYE